MANLKYFLFKLSRRDNCRKRARSLFIKNRGFTLIELLVVVVIIVAAAVMAIPMFSSAGSIQVRSAANMIAADLEYAKTMAITRGQYYSVAFDTDAESYSIKDQDGQVIAHPVKKGFDYIIDFGNDSRMSKVNIADVDFDSDEEIKFDYLGSPHDSAGDPLTSGVITLEASGVTITVSIEPITGFISISD